MADTLAVDVKASLAWLFQDTLDLTVVADQARLEYAKSLPDGIAADQADKLWHDQRSLAGSASESLDLTALTNSIYGNTVTINFAKVKAVLIVNLNTTAGEDLLVGAAAAAAWTAPFNGDANAKVFVPADSALLLVNKKNGWTVTNGSSDVLKVLNNSAATVSYRIAVVGTSA